MKPIRRRALAGALALLAAAPPHTAAQVSGRIPGAAALYEPVTAQPPPELDTPRMREALAQFMAAPLHRALMVSPRGVPSWSGDAHSVSAAVTNAEQRCPGSHAAPCRVYAINEVRIAAPDWRSVPERDPAAPAVGGAVPERFVRIRGPAEAAGILIWLHGLGAEDATGSPPMTPAVELWREGFDLYRRERRDNAGGVTAIEMDVLRDTVREARSRGYRTVILAGKSVGGWTILGALAVGAEPDAALALAPAIHGELNDPALRARAAAEFERLVASIPSLRTRLAVALFEQDRFDPGGRGDVLRARLGAGSLPLLLIDRPADVRSHDAGGYYGFSSRYGACLTRFLLTGERVTPCE